MKKHLISLFDSAHLWWTISLIALGALLIIIASLIGVSDNPPGIILFYGGIIALFFAVLHPWKKATNYAILAAVCIGIILLLFLVVTVFSKMDKGEYLNDSIADVIIFFFCFPGILVGIIGAIICAVRTK